eukprot:3667208-Pyramimonas_sp.AAC.1
MGHASLHFPASKSCRCAKSAAAEKGIPVGVVSGARGPALGSWEGQPPAAFGVVYLSLIHISEPTRPEPI